MRGPNTRERNLRGDHDGTFVALRPAVVADLLFSVENLFVLAGGLALLGIVLTVAGWGGLLAFLALELTELVLCVDSVPGVFAVVDDPIVGWVSNVLALAGLRWLGGLTETRGQTAGPRSLRSLA